MLVRIAVLAFALGSSAASAAAQTPLAFGPLEPPAALSATLRTTVVEKASQYPFAGFRLFGRDSVLLVFDDSTLTGRALETGTWMFGPPVTTAEADSCPPEKVLGRRIARLFWDRSGRPADMQLIMVAVRGTKGIDRWTVSTMYYPRHQLDGPWAGDDMFRARPANER